MSRRHYRRAVHGCGGDNFGAHIAAMRWREASADPSATSSPGAGAFEARSAASRSELGPASALRRERRWALETPESAAFRGRPRGRSPDRAVMRGSPVRVSTVMRASALRGSDEGRRAGRKIARERRRASVFVTAAAAPRLERSNRRRWIPGRWTLEIARREAARSPAATAIFSARVRLFFELT